MATTRPLHVSGGLIRTMEPTRPTARSMTLRDGRVAALDESPPPDADSFDLAGAVAVPGLIDAHMHLVEGGEHLTRLDLSRVSDRASFVAAVARRHAALEPDAWLLGVGWAEDRWGGALPDHTWLEGAEDRPVVCWRIDLHAVLVNDVVLRMIGDTEDPPGGRIVRDPAGRATGRSGHPRGGCRGEVGRARRCRIAGRGGGGRCVGRRGRFGLRVGPVLCDDLGGHGRFAALLTGRRILQALLLC